MALRLIRCCSPAVPTVGFRRGCYISSRSTHLSLYRSSLTLAPDATKSHSLYNGHSFQFSKRQFSTKDEPEDTKKDSPGPILVYESPFASLTLKLKRVSLTSAVIGIVGLPILTVVYGAGDVPATGQLAVIATAGVAAVGSTFLLGYCFSPYVHTLEILNKTLGDGEEQSVRMVTRDILARRVETIFNPATDVSAPPQNNTRPFCNFMVHGKPFYIHPDLVGDSKLRVQLVGEVEEVEEVKKKTDDDEFI